MVTPKGAENDTPQAWGIERERESGKLRDLPQRGAEQASAAENEYGAFKRHRTLLVQKGVHAVRYRLD